MTRIAQCRACGAAILEPVLSLGEMPLANALVDESDPAEHRFPLDVVRCPGCTLVQITETVPPETLFREYPYFSSFSETFVAHARTFAGQMRDRLGLAERSLVVEAASNDGYLLQFFADAGVPVLGIEPARNVARAARERGIETVDEFLDAELARVLVSQRGPADLVIANNVLAHVADLHGFVEGLRTLAGDRGIVSVEVPYLCELVDGLEFDTIYHEHLCYFSLSALSALLSRHGLDVVDVERIPVHGGSLRVLARPAGAGRPSESVVAMLESEARWGVARPGRYAEFAHGVDAARVAIARLVRDLVGRGETVAGYGAAAKAVVLLHACGLDRDAVHYVVDRNPYKQGKLLPGVRIPIRPPDALIDARPGYVLLFVWNIAAEVTAQQRPFLEGGGKFIVPIPQPRVVGSRD